MGELDIFFGGRDVFLELLLIGSVIIKSAAEPHQLHFGVLKAFANLIALLDHGFDPGRLFKFTNYTGEPGNSVWPPSDSITYAILLGMLLPAYTLNGFDAAAQTSAVDRLENVPFEDTCFSGHTLSLHHDHN